VLCRQVVHKCTAPLKVRPYGAIEIQVMYFFKNPIWILLEIKTMEVAVTTGSIRRATLQSNRHHQQTNTQLFTGKMPFLSPNQQCQSTE